MKNLLLYLRTVRYLRISQILHRLKHSIKKLIQGKSVLPAMISGGRIPTSFTGRIPPIGTGFPAHRTTPDEELKYGKIRVFGDTVDLDSLSDWNPEDKSRLWRYNLHYFDFLPRLAAICRETGDEGRKDRIKDVIRNWIENNPPYLGDGWDPYPLSLRIVNWIKAIMILDGRIPGKAAIMKELYRQTARLSGNLEFHIMGNHLVKNAKALIFAGVFFGKERWREKGKSVMIGQIDEQILSDGGHFELSPTYHAVVLEDFLDTANLLGDSMGREDKLDEMVRYLQCLTHPDGKVALFGDSSLDTGLPTAELLDYYRRVTGRGARDSINLFSCSSSGYYGLSAGGTKLAVDCGKVGPSYLPAHGHCDLLSYELSVMGERLVIDTGNYDYEKGEYRIHCRSTKAHNTVHVDGYEQHETWSVFRVARRSFPGKTSFEYQDGTLKFRGSYKHYSGAYRHKRAILFHPDRFMIVRDSIDLRRKSNFKTYIHLSPSAVNMKRRTDSLSFDFLDRKIEITVIGQGRLFVEKGGYFPDFHRKEEISVVNIAPENGDSTTYLINFSGREISVDGSRITSGGAVFDTDDL